MILGVDLDNTLVCYDAVFFTAARDGGLIPDGVAPTKAAVRDHLRAAGREDEWTELQGRVYGALMPRAQPFPGAVETLREAGRNGWRVVVISHRSPRPYRGPAFDLHSAARAWLASGGVTPLCEAVYLEGTQEAKLARVRAVGCAAFIDDLPEFLGRPGFPEGCRKILFSPGGANEGCPFDAACSWREVGAILGFAPR